MSKSSKSKKSKVPKLTEAEYAEYVSSLKNATEEPSATPMSALNAENSSIREE